MNWKCHCLRAAGIVIAATATLIACAGEPSATDQMAVSEAAIINAMVAGAEDRAPAELQRARDLMDMSRAELARSHSADARRLAARAAIHAQLAETSAARVSNSYAACSTTSCTLGSP